MRVFNSLTLPELDDNAQQLVYCGLDSSITIELYHKFKGMLGEVEPLYNSVRDSIPSYLSMSQRGIRIDSEKKKELLDHLEIGIAVGKKWFSRLTGEVFGTPINPNSSIQLQKLFYVDLSVPKVVRSFKGKRRVTTDRRALETIQKTAVRARPFCEILLALRDDTKLVEVLTKKLDNERWKAGFNLGGTETGRRSSSSHPKNWGANLMNLDKEVRIIFVPDPGYIFLSYDQQGAEARVVAYISGDENYIKGVESGDIHTWVAALTWGFEPIRELAERPFYRGKSYRDMAKILGHGTNYDGTSYTLAIQTTIERQAVEDFQVRYNKAFPGIKRWKNWTATQIQTKGVLYTPFGRRRQFWGRLNDDSVIREGIAYVPQSVVGELTRLSIKGIKEELPQIQLLNDVHDNVLTQVPEGDWQFWDKEIRKKLRSKVDITDVNGVTRHMVIPWDGAVGYNWKPYNKKKNENERGLREIAG